MISFWFANLDAFANKMDLFYNLPLSLTFFPKHHYYQPKAILEGVILVRLVKNYYWCNSYLHLSVPKLQIPQIFCLNNFAMIFSFLFLSLSLDFLVIHVLLVTNLLWDTKIKRNITVSLLYRTIQITKAKKTVSSNNGNLLLRYL